MTVEQPAIELPKFPTFHGGLRSLRRLGTAEIPTLGSTELEALPPARKSSVAGDPAPPRIEGTEEASARASLRGRGGDPAIEGLATQRRLLLGLLLFAVAGTAVLWVGYVLPQQAALAERASIIQQLEAREEDSVRLRSSLEDELEGMTAERDALAGRLAQREAGARAVTGSAEGLSAALADEISRGALLVREEDGMVVLDLPASALFERSSLGLTREGKALLRKIGKRLKSIPGLAIEVGGHTAAERVERRLRRSFASNWELSAGRAVAVARTLQWEARLSEDQLRAIGYAAGKPVAPNKTRLGRARNHRVEIALRQRDAL